jgi:ferredoxin--NADP+ reductase
VSDPHAPNATIVRRRDVNERVTILHVQPDGGRIAPFVAGQFVQIGMPADVAAPPTPSGPPTPTHPLEPSDPPARTKLVKRSYSIASAPRETGAYELCIAFVDEGKLTSKLKPLHAGDRVWHDPTPKGIFTLEKVPDGLDLVFVATATGVAPFISMWREYRDKPGRFKRFVVVYGAREQSDLAYHEELLAAEREDPRVRYVPVLSRESNASTWSGLRGHVQVALDPARTPETLGFALDPSSTRILLCGNPAMIEEVREMVLPHGFVADTARHPGNVHFERYW